MCIRDSNSLHTNAYNEAVTTPTSESVRRALAIQLIINEEWGLAMNENPNQGSFIIEELTDLVEEAVLSEFDRITERGGVLGAMETMYQRGKIQEESLYYETLKHTGELPLIGVIDRMQVISAEGKLRKGKPVPRIVFGPTCDSVDRLPGEIPLPADLEEGDFVVWQGMGSYSTVTNTRFNGFGELGLVTVLSQKL